MEKENREHKDSVFVDLFYQDETAKKNLLSLYNALHDTNYEDETIIRKVKIDDVLYKNFKNDISCEVNGQVLVFGEHMSTINRNMPLRCLMYVGRAYEQLVDSKARYRMTLVNINSDKAHEILDKCGILKEYSQFISTVRKYSYEESAIKKAIKECIEKGILADYLKRKGSEVENMLIAEYSYEEDIQVKQEEARQEGIWQGRREGITLSADIFQMVKKNPDLTNVQIAENLGCSVEDVESTRKMFGI